jgi:hypothetical protein
MSASRRAEKDILLSHARIEPETEQISSPLGLALARALVMGSFPPPMFLLSPTPGLL